MKAWSMARGDAAEKFRDSLEDFKSGSYLINFIFYNYHYYHREWNRSGIIKTRWLVRRLLQ